MTSEVKMLPCPFCGEVPTTIEADADQGYKWGRVRCCIEGPEVRTGYDKSGDAPWHAEAIAAWNRRAAPDALAAIEAHAAQMFWKGWMAAAELGSRDDLLADRDSPFYERKLKEALADRSLAKEAP